MTRRRLVVALGILIGCQLVSAQNGPQCLSMKSLRFLDEHGTAPNKQALAVDADGRILLVNPSSSGRPIDYEPLGYEQVAPPDFPFSSAVPKTEGLLTLRPVSCAERGWRLWVAETIGLEDLPRRKQPVLSNHLYVFRQCNAPATEKGTAGHDCVTATGPVIAEKFREISDLVVDDINGDQRTEIAVQYTDPVIGPWMKIWQVDDAGELHAISLEAVRRDIVPADSHVEIGLGDYLHGGELLFTEQRVPTNRGWHVTRRYYDWNVEKQRYDLAEVVQTDEITLK